MRNGLFALLAANKGRGQFHAQATRQDEATIWLYDAIVSDDYWGGVSALSLGKALAEHRDKSTIHLRINSPGGDVFAGRAMEALLAEHPAKIVTHIDGYAASAASYVALAGADRIISPGGMVMIHKAWTIAWGNADDIRKTAGLLDQIDTTLVATYQAKTGQPEAQIRDWLTAETWFDANQAVQYGFATAIAGEASPDDQPEDDDTANTSTWDFGAYQRPPARNSAPVRRPQAHRTPEKTPDTAPTFDRAAALRHLTTATL